MLRNPDKPLNLRQALLGGPVQSVLASYLGDEFVECCWGGDDSKGRRPELNSYAVTPRDHLKRVDELGTGINLNHSVLTVNALYCFKYLLSDIGRDN